MEQAKDYSHKHPVIGPAILIVIVLGAAVTVANQLVSLLKNVGVIP